MCVCVCFSQMKNVSLCNDHCWTGRVIVWHSTNFKFAIFSDSTNVTSVKLCMMVLLQTPVCTMPDSMDFGWYKPFFSSRETPLFEWLIFYRLVYCQLVPLPVSRKQFLVPWRYQILDSTNLTQISWQSHAFSRYASSKTDTTYVIILYIDVLHLRDKL